MTETEALLLPGLGSAVVALTVAVLVTFTPAEPDAVAVTVRVALAPLARVPMAQTPPVYVPELGVAETKVRPLGRASVTETPAAALGPLFLTVMVKMTCPPTAGVALLTVLVMDRSADTAGVTEAEALLLPGLGSAVVALTVAVLVTFTPAEPDAVAVIVRVALAPLARVPIVQIPVLLLYSAVGLADTKVSPDGRTSLTITLVAALGPLLVTFIVKTTFSPTVGVALLTILAMDKSAEAPGLAGLTVIEVPEAETVPSVTVIVWDGVVFSVKPEPAKV